MPRTRPMLSACLCLVLLASTVPCVVPYAGAPPVPRIIQGGMGVRISSWKLAREVARKGELGVISGTAMDTIFVRTLQDGDPGGAFRRALATFPDQDMVARAMDRYFIEDGKEATKPYRSLPMWNLKPPQHLLEATVLGNYCEVWLAKHNDDGSEIGGVVGINRLTKVAMPTIPSLYGAMLAGVDYVIMGAGIPIKIPGILDALAKCKDCEMPIEVAGASDDQHFAQEFSPSEFWSTAGKPHLAETELKRPAFLPIVSSVVLAQSLLKRADGAGPNKGIDGFVIELNTAGGHNAPPRGFRYDPNAHDNLNEKGEPIYGPKDDVDLLKFLKASHGLPFWLAGSYGKADKFCDVMDAGGAGVQVGTLFALAKESGMDEKVRENILSTLAERDLEVFTDPAASPTGFPFKVLNIEGTLANEETYLARPRVCNLGYLRSAYMQPDGKVGYRCPSEPMDDWVKKGGDIEATRGRKCLCNGLCADAGCPQVRNIKDENGMKSLYVEQGLVTIGDDVNTCRLFMKQDEDGKWSYSAGDVVDYLKSEWEAREAGIKPGAAEAESLQKEIMDTINQESVERIGAFVDEYELNKLDAKMRQEKSAKEAGAFGLEIESQKNEKGKAKKFNEVMDMINKERVKRLGSFLDESELNKLDAERMEAKKLRREKRTVKTFNEVMDMINKERVKRVGSFVNAGELNKLDAERMEAKKLRSEKRTVKTFNEVMEQINQDTVRRVGALVDEFQLNELGA